MRPRTRPDDESERVVLHYNSGPVLRDNNNLYIHDFWIRPGGGLYVIGSHLHVLLMTSLAHAGVEFLRERAIDQFDLSVNSHGIRPYVDAALDALKLPVPPGRIASRENEKVRAESKELHGLLGCPSEFRRCSHSN